MVSLHPRAATSYAPFTSLLTVRLLLLLCPSDWRSHFYEGLRLRNRLQRDNYTDIVEACQRHDTHDTTAEHGTSFH